MSWTRRVGTGPPPVLRLALVALLLLAGAYAAPGDAAAAGWTAPISIQPSSPSTAGTDSARVVANARGDQVVIWDDMREMGSDAPVCSHSEVATRVAGGAWSAPAVVPCDAKIAI